MHTSHHEGPAARGAPIAVVLAEYDTGWHDPDGSLERAESIVAEAAAKGARLVVLPEMCTTGFTMDAAQATSVEGPHVGRLRIAARENGMWLVAGVALREEREPAQPTNVALVISPAGEVVAMHRKQRLFAYAGEHEHYREGASPTIVEIDGVRIAPFVCYELRFPELFRAVARDVHAMIVIANWPVARRAHWDALFMARAIENQCVVMGVNRVGSADGIDYDGGSRALGPLGERIDQAEGALRVALLDRARVDEIRRQFPFLEDMR